MNARWRRLLMCIVALLSCCAWATTWAAAPFARVSLQGKQPVLVGQQVHLNVTVLTPNYFTSAPPFPPLNVPGAIVTMPDESGMNSTETINGVTYAAIQKSYIFSAQQAGEFTLPPVKISFKYGGDDGKPQQGTVSLPPFKIRAALPAGAVAAAGAASAGSTSATGVMPVARVTIAQHFDQPLSGNAPHAHLQVEAGEALVRTLDTYAAQTQAMMIPPPRADAPPGVRVFAADPQLNDITQDRVGLVGGRRIDKLTYVFEKAGRYTLPAIDVAWFNAAAGKPEQAEAPAVDIEVVPRTNASAAIAPEAASAASANVAARPHIKWMDAARMLSVVVIGIVLLWWVVRWLWRRMPAWRHAWLTSGASRRNSEPALFRAVAQACARGDAQRTYAALLAWSSQHVGSSVRAWCTQLGATELAAGFALLEQRLYGSGAVNNSTPPWQAASFSRLLKRARADWLRQPQRHVAARVLPPLNP